MGSHEKRFKERQKSPKDNFYTLYETVAQEVETYPLSVWKNKHVYCPCDAEWSNYTKYFLDNFERLQLKQLTCSNITDGRMMTITNAGDKPVWKKMEEDVFYPAGDFRSFQAKELMKQCDIVVTNPPFSISLEFLDQVVAYEKQFLYIAFQAQLNCRNVFKEIMRGNLVVGNTLTHCITFRLDDSYEVKPGSGYENEKGEKFAEVACVWFTNLPTNSKKLKENNVEDVESYIAGFKRFQKFPEVVNFKWMKDVPTNYYGVMGVPLTYLKFHNPNDYIIHGRNGYNGGSTHGLLLEGSTGSREFARVFIQKIKKD